MLLGLHNSGGPVYRKWHLHLNTIIKIQCTFAYSSIYPCREFWVHCMESNPVFTEKRVLQCNCVLPYTMLCSRRGKFAKLIPLIWHNVWHLSCKQWWSVLVKTGNWALLTTVWQLYHLHRLYQIISLMFAHGLIYVSTQVKLCHHGTALLDTTWWCVWGCTRHGLLLKTLLSPTTQQHYCT